MSLSFLVPSRTVLLVSDEVLSVMSVNSSGVKLVDSVPWTADNFETNVADILAKDCGKKPVLILNDMVEQHYRKERVVGSGVNFMDRAAMLKRKLNVAFPNYPIRAAYPLKEKVSGSGRTSNVYIFAAVSGSEQIGKTIAATRRSLVSMSALCLLPVESSDMVKALSAKKGLRNKKGKKNVWTVFVGQHSNGSLRQILTKNGELALTRMSPIVDTDEDPHVWAGEVYREFKATMSYLTRFGYDAEDGLDVFVIAGSEGGEAFKSVFDEDCGLHVMPVTDAARALGVRIGPQASERCADPLHAAWAGRKSSFILPMKAAQIDEVSAPRKAALVVGIALLAGASILGFQALSKVGVLSDLRAETNVFKQRQAQLDAQYQREVQRLEDVGFDVKLVQSSLVVYDDLEKERIKILELVKGVGQGLGKDLRVDTLEVERVREDGVQQVYGQIVAAVRDGEPAKPLYKATLRMTYPATTDVERGNQEVQNLSNRLKSLMPSSEVDVSKFLKDYEYTEGLVVEAGDLEKENVDQEFVAEIVIKGFVPK